MHTNKELVIRNQQVNDSVKKLDDLLRAEYNTKYNYLDYFAGIDILREVNGVKYQVIYGRRGTGKTHLLKALQEQLLENSVGCLPVYMDLRSYKPILGTDNNLYYSLIVFKEIIIEILKCVYENMDYLYKEYEDDRVELVKIHRNKIQKLLNQFNRNFDGTSFNKIGDVDFKIEEIKKLAATLQIKNLPEISGDIEKSQKIQKEDKRIKYISFSDMSEAISELFNIVDIQRLYCLLDEWSEIPETSQFILAELIKRTFMSKCENKITMKIAAIPNRTRLLGEDRIGLEDGGDIFGYSLDNRYIYELNQENTRVFFNELLFKQLRIVNSEFYNNYLEQRENIPVYKFINYFFANQALKEVLIASAGIPRDFLNIFVRAYKRFYDMNKNKHIVLADVRQATTDWYNTDKKKAIDVQTNAKLLLEKIIGEILVDKNRCHFLVPEKYENNSQLNTLIDLRVIHLRKRGISHKGKRGVRYNVYYLDYACYTSSNIYHNKINTNLPDVEMVDDFRKIRRISLEDKFFEEYNLEIGDGFKCPHCGNIIDINHPAYQKLRRCNHCCEIIEQDK